jgi:hypothetical protein
LSAVIWADCRPKVGQFADNFISEIVQEAIRLCCSIDPPKDSISSVSRAMCGILRK